MKMVLLLLAAIILGGQGQLLNCPSAVIVQNTVQLTLNPTTSSKDNASVNKDNTSTILFTLDTSSQVQYYTFPFSTKFTSPASVAIALRQLQSQPSDDMFLSIRVLPVPVIESVQFIIAVKWRYTSWQLVQFSFVAENHGNIVANTFVIDTPSLAIGDLMGQASAVVNCTLSGCNYESSTMLVFLNGFEMSTSATFSLFQASLTILNFDRGVFRIGVLSNPTCALSVLYASYIVYDSSQISFQSRIIQWTSSATMVSTELTLQPQINNIVSIFFGLTDICLVNRKQGLQLNLEFTLDKRFIVSTTGDNLSGVTVSAFFLVGTECASCNGFPMNSKIGCLEDT